MAPYSGDAYDLITNKKIADGSRLLVEKKVAKAQSKNSTVYERLIADWTAPCCGYTEMSGNGK